MVLMKYFCFCFPVRLGVLVITTLVIVENLAVMSVILLYSAEDLKVKAEKFEETKKTLSSPEYFNIFLKYVVENPDEFLLISLSICCSMLIACILNIVASLSKFRWLSIPFILIQFLEISIILACHVTYMILMKKLWNLGVLILACCIGGFGILYLLYLWGVTVAMFQMIGVVNSDDYKERMLRDAMSLSNSMKMNKNMTVAAISSSAELSDYPYNSEMLSRDFSELYRKNTKRI